MQIIIIIIIHIFFKNVILGSPEKGKEEMMFEIYGILYKSYWYYREFDMMLFKQIQMFSRL